MLLVVLALVVIDLVSFRAWARHKLNRDVEHSRCHSPSFVYVFPHHPIQTSSPESLYTIQQFAYPKMTERRMTVVSSPGKVLIAGGYLVLDTNYSGLVIGTSSRFYSCVSSRLSSASSTSNISNTDPGTDTETCQGKGKGDEAIISVRAGQFPSKASTWFYSISKPSASATFAVGEDGEKEGLYLGFKEINEEQAGKNKFIFITLCKVLEYAYETILAKLGNEETALDELIKRIKGSGDGLEVVVFADNDFYSQREQVRYSSLFWWVRDNV